MLYSGDGSSVVTRDGACRADGSIVVTKDGACTAGAPAVVSRSKRWAKKSLTGCKVIVRAMSPKAIMKNSLNELRIDMEVESC